MGELGDLKKLTSNVELIRQGGWGESLRGRRRGGGGIELLWYLYQFLFVHKF